MISLASWFVGGPESATSGMVLERKQQCEGIWPQRLPRPLSNARLPGGTSPAPSSRFSQRGGRLFGLVQSARLAQDESVPLLRAPSQTKAWARSQSLLLLDISDYASQFIFHVQSI